MQVSNISLAITRLSRAGAGSFAPGFLLLEGGDFLLLETGDYIILE